MALLEFDNCLRATKRICWLAGFAPWKVLAMLGVTFFECCALRGGLVLR